MANMYYDTLETVSNDYIDKKQKIKWIIMFYHTIVLVIICSLLLIIICITCYYIKLWLKQKIFYHIDNTKTAKNSELKGIDTKNRTCYYLDGIEINDLDSDNTEMNGKIHEILWKSIKYIQIHFILMNNMEKLW